MNLGFFEKFAGKGRFLGLKIGCRAVFELKNGVKVSNNCKKFAKVCAF